MLGNQETYGLHAKAAESHGLLKFVLWLLEKYSDEFEKLPEETSRPLAILKAATQAANSMDDILLSRMQCQHLMQHYLRFLTLYLKAGGVWRPKCHLPLHLIQRAMVQGDPRLYSTYRDESLNGVIAKIARSAHRSTWGNVIHFKCCILNQRSLEAIVGAASSSG